MNAILEDYKELIRTNGELDYKCDAGQSFEEIYELSGYKDELINLCTKYEIDFNDEEIDWDWGNYIQNKTEELITKLESIIIRSNEEIFDAQCKTNNIDKKEMSYSIIQAIDKSNLDDKDMYRGEYTKEDEYGQLYDRDCLYIDSDILLVIELTDKQKQFIQLALDCDIREIYL